MKHKITKRLILYFTLTLLVFACLIGTLFSLLFMKYSSHLHADDLKKRAVSIANSISSLPDFNTLHADRMAAMHQQMDLNHMHQGRMHGAGWQHENTAAVSGNDTSTAAAQKLASKMNDYDSYLRMLDEVAQSEVWIVDEEARTIDLYQHGQVSAPHYEDLPPEAEQVLQQIFSGDVPVSENFSTLLGTPSVTAGAPIRDANGSIIAALLLHRDLKDMNKAEHGGFAILGICLLAAFLISIPLSILLARRFIRPLQRMEGTASALALGNYNAQTGIQQDDEIGSLAQSIDTLAHRLSEAERESARLDKMRQDFITSISHELRTPITVLRGSLEVLQAGLIDDPAEKQEYLQQMMTNIIHLQRLVNDLLELTRLQNTDFTIEKTAINLTDALNDALHTARQLAEKKHLRLEVPHTPCPIAMEADYGRIRQMFLIILDNAVKFSPADSLITVTLEADDPHWTIAIRDQGCGISETELPHIFERFHRAADKSNPDGTGLGLAIASQIAEHHGIRLRCESTPGKGSCFFFSK